MTKKREKNAENVQLFQVFSWQLSVEDQDKDIKIPRRYTSAAVPPVPITRLLSVP